MNTNFIWHNDKSNHVFYVPSDQVKTLGSKNLEKDFVQKVTKDGRTIYLLKDSPLPEHVKPLFDSTDTSEFKSIQKKVAVENSEQNKKQGLSGLMADNIREISRHSTKATQVTFAHATKRLHDLTHLTPADIKKNKDIMKYAADENNLEVLKWAYDQKAPADFEYIFERALEHGNIETLDWASDKLKGGYSNSDFILKAVENAVIKKDTHLIKWLMRKYEVTSSNNSSVLTMFDMAKSVGKSKDVDLFRWFAKIYYISERVANQLINQGEFSDKIKLLIAAKAAQYRSARGY